jgi:hypothetical protein
LSSALGGLNALTGGQGSDSLSLLANSGFDSSSLGGSGLGGGIGGGVPGYGFTGGISPLSLITNILQGLLSFLSPSPPIENTGIFGGGAPGPAGGLDNFSSGGFIPSLSRADVGGLNPQPLDQPAAVQARQIIFGQVKPGTELRDPTAQGRLTQLRQLLLGL